MSASQSATLPVVRCNGSGRSHGLDPVALEEPLEMRLRYRRDRWMVTRNVAVTLRTPGNDRELAVGFLVSEGFLRSPDQIATVQSLGHDAIEVSLRENVRVSPKAFDRGFAVHSSCGICGKRSLDLLDFQLRIQPVFDEDGVRIPESTLHALPERLLRAQDTFRSTGGLHAAGLFNSHGDLLALREDIGRHNAVDKVLGAMWSGDVKRGDILLVSGRAGFELVQKAISHRVPFLAAIGAPSSLAVQVAKRFHLTLVGFLRNDRFNIYSGENWISRDV
jgi:FdhD protein